MGQYIQKSLIEMPRIPLSGRLDLTYRCNNNCRHCWLWTSPQAPEVADELTFDEIRKIVDDARSFGCRDWSISGGEPMLRPDFEEIFTYITAKSISYSINTNGTLITPQIATLLKHKGTKMIALYGATAQTHDYVTRSSGSFEAVMRGMRYMKEAGAGFMVQLIPMKDNYHEFDAMVSLAQTLSKYYRIGAAWLYLSANRDPQRNQEILAQRLSPREVINLDLPDLSADIPSDSKELSVCGSAGKGAHFFQSCIQTSNEFHVDPYGKMSFCSFVKDPSLRYDLKKGTFREGWETFIPSLMTKLPIPDNYRDACGNCLLQADCRLCPVYAWLEHGRYDTRIDYLCAAARENRSYKEQWLRGHRRYFQIAGITLQVDFDMPVIPEMFEDRFIPFMVNEPGEDIIAIRHHNALPDMAGKDLGRERYRKAPWAIYEKGSSWIYTGISPDEEDKSLHQVAVFNHDHSRARIYSKQSFNPLIDKIYSLTMFSTDQILLARILADREGCFIHSSGVDFNGQGVLFVGHSGAGKSTMIKMLKGRVDILCDDRVIVRRHQEGFRIHGTWSHGEVPDVSAASAPLKVIYFLHQAKENRVELVANQGEIVRCLLACLIKPFATCDWWEKTLPIIEQIAHTTSAYKMFFDKSGDIVNILSGERV